MKVFWNPFEREVVAMKSVKENYYETSFENF